MRALTQASLRSPAAVAVGVAITILFGAFALNALPVQLFPDIDRPQIGIGTLHIVRHRCGIPWQITRKTHRHSIAAPCAITQVHSGQITVESTLGKGTRFRVLLPLAR